MEKEPAFEARSTKQPRSISLLHSGAASRSEPAPVSAEVGGRRVEEGLCNHARGVDFISGRVVGAGRNGVGGAGDLGVKRGPT